MKKRFVSFVLCCILLAVCVFPAQASIFNTLVKYGTLSTYTNLLYGYSIDVYSVFNAYTDTQMLAYLNYIDSNADEDDDYIYDIRCWQSNDENYFLQITVKEKTYASLDDEIENAPRYAETMMAASDDGTVITQLHDGILRSTPMGDMLEMATSYPESEKNALNIYYDCYRDNAEYIFSLTAYDGDYTAAQKLLNTMVQTVTFFNGRYI